jgi:hypothetical protein
MEKPRKNQDDNQKFSILRSFRTIEILHQFSKKYKQPLSEMKELRYRASVLPVSRRVLSHWRDSNLLDPYGDNSDQINISFVSLFWLLIAIELRTFGLSLEKINGIKESFFANSKLPLFETYLFLSHIDRSTDFFLIVSAKGQADVGVRSEIEISESLGLIEENYIRINFATIRNRIFHNKKEEIFKQKFENIYLTKGEKTVFELIRSGDYKEIALKFSDGNIIRIESKKYIESPNPFQEIKQIINSNVGFCEINLKMVNGTFVAMENVIMKKT